MPIKMPIYDDDIFFMFFDILYLLHQHGLTRNTLKTFLWLLEGLQELLCFIKKLINANFWAENSYKFLPNICWDYAIRGLYPHIMQYITWCKLFDGKKLNDKIGIKIGIFLCDNAWNFEILQILNALKMPILMPILSFFGWNGHHILKDHIKIKIPIPHLSSEKNLLEHWNYLWKFRN